MPPQWSVTLASMRRDGTPMERSSDVCDASAPAVAPTQAAPRDRLKKDAKRPRQGDHQDTHRARPPPVGPLKRGGGGLATWPMAATAPCPVAAMGIVTQWAIRLQTSDFYGPSPPTPNPPSPP